MALVAVRAAAGKAGAVKIGAPQPLERWQAGKIVRVGKTTPYNHNSPATKGSHKGLVGPYPGVNHKTGGSCQYWGLHDPLTGGTTYVVKEGSELFSVSKEEQGEYTRDMMQKITTIPKNVCVCATGSDPEVFAVRKDGSCLPAFEFLPNKKQPQFYGTHELQKMFYDGFQAEYTIPAQGCHQYATSYLWDGLRAIYVAARKIDPDARLVAKDVIDLTPEQLQCPPEHLELGCEPSKNAYFDGPNPVLASVIGAELPFRFAGFHLHFALNNATYKKESFLKKGVKAIDAIAGVLSVAVLAGLEDPRRRRYYGLAGEYRAPSHGLEYRVLSSAALCHPAVTNLLMDFSRCALGMAADQKILGWEASTAEVTDCINNLDVELAKTILGRNKRLVEVMANSIYGSGNMCAGKVIRLIEKGAKSLLDTDLVKSWRLDRETIERTPSHFITLRV